MTPIILVDTLIQFIESVVADFQLQTNVKDAPAKAPQVIAGYLDEKKPDKLQNPPDFPHVIVRFLEDTDTDAEDVARIKIIAGTYSEDFKDGWRDCMNVITRIKLALLEQPFHGPFEVGKPMKTDLPEEQPYPEWVAELTVSVTIPQIQAEGGYLLDVIE